MANRAKATTRPKFISYPFTLGVASGDPLPGGVLLWTRLAPEPLELDGHGGMPAMDVTVRWEVAKDEKFQQVVRKGKTTAVTEFAHSVHVEVDGLAPDTEYFYRFHAGPEVSPVGRTKTLPELGTPISELMFGYVSCQAWYEGYYTAYQHMLADDLDFVIHLGDYVYEYGVGANGGVRGVSLPDQYQQEMYELAEYRNRHALYRSDTNLQAAHAAFPWIITMDDHEVENNWADEESQDDSEPDQDNAVFLQRRAAAFKAYYEHMPVRPSALPQGPDMRIYRRFAYGNLASFNILDTRQYRDNQACGDGLRIDCEERLDPARTMTGDRQEQWLLDGLAASKTTWNVLAQQVIMAQLDHEPDSTQAFSMDLWDGYKASRDRIFGGMLERGVRNPVVITGDAHRNLAANLKEDFDNPDSAIFGVEFCGTSVSSGGDGQDMDPYGEKFLAANPHVKFSNAQRGYVRCTVTPDDWRADFRTLPYVTEPEGPVYTRASFRSEAGNPGLELIDKNPPQGNVYGTEFHPDYLED